MREVAELNGDGIASELRDAIHALNEALGSPVAFRPIDWSVDTARGRRCRRRRRHRGDEDARRGDEVPDGYRVDQPQPILRDHLDLAVIHRPCRTYPGVSTNYTGKIDLHVVRVATGGSTKTPASASATTPR